MCRTRFAIDVKDAKNIERHVHPDKYGVHRTGTLGDLRAGIKDLATLIGLNVIEEDAWQKPATFRPRSSESNAARRSVDAHSPITLISTRLLR